ncbi:efflux RND transporter periplasmic adaptor subunit [Ulvibacterium marinum]|uniref:Efflux RND transporter periplasmic adaptor subunit n=1 Tax=Ulvibacterium marinum TaxID=2419782 RepID=A0A3B0C626_9FLAO|nr:efflux RND transporter periplasmic adaptor subunit [Ulvibacterium marinum]RKN80291.1 efflux RND transporter periplasmic adaptor subunit [Ulvibacterium marinum]
MQSKKTKIGIGIGALLVAVALGYFLMSTGAKEQLTAEFVMANKGDVTTMVTATGTIQPVEQVDVGTQVSGVVEKIYVDYNGVVTAGQLIAELDKTNLRATLAQQQAAYNNAINYRDYKQNIYNRQKTLYDNQVISKSDYDDAVYELNNAKNTAAERLSDLQKAKTNLSYANIYSPIDGVVLSRDVDEGQTVAASLSTPTLFTIAKDLRQMQVEADVDEADIGQVKEGQRVSFTVDAYQGEEFDGEVTQVRLNPTTTSNVVTYTVVVKADNPDLKLKPGLTATIAIYTVELKDVLTVEAKAVNFKPNRQLLMAYNAEDTDENPPPRPDRSQANNDKKSTLLWMDDNGKIRPVEVELGTSDGVNVQVMSGLKEGDRLAYQIKASEGEKVSQTEEEGESPFMPSRPPGGGRPR